ncbi:hypothetical protein [Rivularia sp. PCC 7116]|nr:hypothetical protein [Rivularia sp. PCC 7116]
MFTRSYQIRHSWREDDSLQKNAYPGFYLRIYRIVMSDISIW